MAERATYGITALRYAGPEIVEAMMGLMDPGAGAWDLKPTPTRVNAVVDRLLEGDKVVGLFRDDRGHLDPGPEVMVGLLPEGVETLATDEERPGRCLADLPRF